MTEPPVIHLHLRGLCPECERVYLLTEQGRIPTHYSDGLPAVTCPGSRRKPEPIRKEEPK